MTKNEIVYLVINALTGGTQGVTNHPFSTQQISCEIDTLRLEMLRNPKVFIDYTQYYQTIDCVELTCVPLQECSELAPVQTILRTKEKMPAFFVPAGKKLVEYIGSADGMHPYHLLSGHVFPYATYTKYVFPEAVYLNGYFYFLHIPENTATIAIRAILERPAEAEELFPCCRENTYRLPGEFIPPLVTRLVETYRTYGSFAVPQPNTQAFVSPVASNSSRQ